MNIKTYIVRVMGIMFLIFALLIPGWVSGQNFQQNKNIAFEKLKRQTEIYYGTSDKLVNGYIYLPIDRRIDGHPYYVPPAKTMEKLYGRRMKNPKDKQLTNVWRSGSVTIHGEKFANQKLKYNIEVDDLILKAQLSGGAQKLIRINSARVDSFRIAGHLFVHSRNYFPTDSIRTYFELVYTGENTFLSRYSKEFIKQFNDLSPRGKYGGLETWHYLLTADGAKKVDRRSKFLNNFDDHRRKIRRFLRRNDIRYRKATPSELNKLMNYINQLTTNSNEE
ncbi:MAG: hypothetical protein K9I94_12690 [Bacteroidales bacterium]|nr:hypothetical protein [Bacteroidales bacterium]